LSVASVKRLMDPAVSQGLIDLIDEIWVCITQPTTPRSSPRAGYTMENVRTTRRPYRAKGLCCGRYWI
ncbi:MAG: hypothetical protein QGM46_05305, partial [Actinomycetota bacterium]|nr:hypothetical protein [Actinomycetota bacterium]